MSYRIEKVFTVSYAVKLVRRRACSSAHCAGSVLRSSSDRSRTGEFILILLLTIRCVNELVALLLWISIVQSSRFRAVPIALP